MNPEDRKDIATGNPRVDSYSSIVSQLVMYVHQLNHKYFEKTERVVDDIFVKGIPPLPLSYK